MKKIVIFSIIFSLLFANFGRFTFAQNEVQTITLPRLECKLPENSLEDIEEESATSTYDYITPLETFKGETTNEGNWWDNVRDFVKNLIQSAAFSFLQSLLGRVPTIAPETNSAIGESIKESMKGVLTSIRTAISLSIKDSQYYLQYRIWSEISNRIQSLISKNYIGDISSYKDLRIFLAYLRAVSSVVDNYKNKRGCIDPDLKPCIENLILAMKNNAQELSQKNPKLEPWVNKAFNYITPKVYNLFCEEPESISGIIKINNVAIKPNNTKLKDSKISFYIKDNYIKANIGSINEPLYFSLIDSNGNEINKIYVDPNKGKDFNLWNLNEISNNLLKNNQSLPKNYNLGIKSCLANVCKLNNLNFALSIKSQQKFNLASIFSNPKRYLSLRNIFSKIPFLAQTYQTGETYYTGGDYPIPYAFETENYLSQCAIVGSGISEDIFNKLQKEIDKVNTILASGGGFKEKTSCLATWDGSSPDNISGDDPRCKIPGPTLSYPDVYKKLQEQVLSGELDIFKNKEQTENLMVAFIRSWIDSKLFNIIDKGFQSLEAKSAGSGYSADVVKAYSKDRINAVCGRMSNLNISGLSENCKAVLQSQGETIVNTMKTEAGGVSKQAKDILKYIKELQDILSGYIFTSRKAINTISEYTTNTTTPELESKMNEFNEVFQDFQRRLNDLSKTLTKSSKISNAFKDRDFKVKVNLGVILNPLNSGDRQKLSFYRDFYPNYIYELDKKDLNLRYLTGGESCAVYSGKWGGIICHPLEGIALDLGMIANIFLGIPKGSVSDESFIFAFQDYINRFINGEVTTTPQFKDEIDTLWVFSSTTKDVLDKLNKFAPTNNLKDSEVTIFDRNNLNYTFVIGDLLDYLSELNNNFYNVLDFLKNSDIDKKINELNKLKKRAQELQNWINEQYEKAWGDLLGRLSPSELDSLKNNLENSKEEIQTIAETSYENCERANDLIEDIEYELNILQKTEENITPSETEETPTLPQSKGLIKTIFASLKNFVGNIFRIFIKPKGIYLK